MLYVGQFGAGLGEGFCAVCGTDWCGFEGLRMCCVCDSLVREFGSEYMLCVGQFCVGMCE